ncbi:probable RNA-binding protein 19 isoform X1 [Stegodyphus dumicola]|uniref:probable RNA-binding protein 19 isoform X1 n=1 Tax=Stegodyphus dumicola TaxID=202533 RepID=UPI0015AD52F1|nr:probable RNA-binding protein 19 isoform X1 [Stegodyphus dumicola]
MSRIIVKNLPKTITDKKLQELFSTKGTITDLQLKYNKSGVFRQFAFIGYKTEAEAQDAKDYFHETFVNTSRIKVEICTDLGDPNKPKPWKQKLEKFSQKINESNKEINKDKEKENKTRKKKHETIPEELMKDAQFREFLEVHSDRKSKPVWCDSNFDDQSVDSKEPASELKDDPEKELEDDDDKQKSKSVTAKELRNTSEKTFDDSFTVKIKNLPCKCRRKQIKAFFHPLRIASLRLPPKQKGFAFVKFKTEKEMMRALNKNKGFLDGHRVDVVKYVKKVVDDVKDKSDKQTENTKEENEELLAETGRIYVRNLCYSVTEAELEELFSKYGPLAEINHPVDLITKQGMGFAFVSYVFAEHAVKAFSALDGTIFQGRVLHLIPAKPKKEYSDDQNETNFKKKKESKMKELSGSSHNWNILFLGMNAVADVISKKYNIDKSELLSAESHKGSGDSVAVRMALAETQAVLESRKFLIDNGVELDALSQPAAERSKTVIVVKDLPAKTQSQEIHELFSKFGTVAKVVVPPSGLMALVEFVEPSEARTAFKKLAYTRFHTTPLFLEWAPINAMKERTPDTAKNQSNETEVKEEETKETAQNPNDENAESDDEPAPNTTIFVKNLNFSTTVESLKKHFQQCGPIHSATISTKKDVKTGKLLSMGFGFVQFKTKSAAVDAVQNLQLSKLDGHALELKFAARTLKPAAPSGRKKQEIKKQLTSKILVRNIPFQASESEVKDLFKQYGELKFVRLPKKHDGSSEHRGFGFVDFCTKVDAKRAFEALCHSTHLYNRRLVLEWANPEADSVTELRKKTAKDFIQGAPKTKVKKSKLMEDVALASARSRSEE